MQWIVEKFFDMELSNVLGITILITNAIYITLVGGPFNFFPKHIFSGIFISLVIGLPVGAFHLIYGSISACKSEGSEE